MRALTHAQEGDIKLHLSSFLPIIVIALAVAPAFALGEGNRNLFLIGIMILSPLIILKFKKLYWSDIWLLLFLFSIVVIPPLTHPESMRWSTVMYSWMFGITFLAYKQLLTLRIFTVKNYMQLLKYLIYAYFVVLLIQQFCVLTGLPIFNLSNYDPATPWKLNSLAAEPSHSARIVALLMYCYITIKEIVTNKKYNFKLNLKEDKWLWIAFLWTMLTMGSGTAFLFIVIIFSKFLSIKNIIYLMLLFSIIFVLINILGIHSFERTYKVFMAVLTLDVDTIIHVDLSAAIRIVPMLILATMVNIVTFNDWFGHGIDYVGTFMDQLVPAVPEGFSAGGMLVIWMEYGFLSFILFVIFSFTTTYRKGDYLTILFWFLLVFMYGVNGQIIWLAIILLYTNKFFYSKKDRRKKI